MNKQGGVALIIVLWMLVLFLLMSFSYSKTMRAETKLAASIVNLSKAKAAAEAGIWYGLDELLKPEQTQTWQVDAMPNRLRFSGAEIEVTLSDENGRFDLNSVNEKLLEKILEKTSIAEDERVNILHSILDWRDRNDTKHLHGNEKTDYQQAGLNYQPKDGPISHTSELQKVIGVTPELYKELKNVITVHSHQPGINLENASKAVLLMLPGINSDNIDELMAMKEEGDIEETAMLYGLESKFINRRDSRIYRISSLANYNEHRMKLDVVFLLRRSGNKPFTLLAWNWADK